MQTYYQFYWEKKDGENIKILRVFGESEEAVIPDTIEGYAVTETGDYCFAASAHLKTEYEHTVCIYDTEKKTWQKMPADSADWSMRLVELGGERLKKLTLPDTVHKIGNYAFYNCNAQDVMHFFEQNGLELKTERGNRVFPASDHSSDVIKTLEQALNKRKVTVRLHHTVTRILTEPVHDRMQNQMRVTGICVKDEKGLQKQEHFDAVIVATGGLSYERTGSTGDGLQFARDLGLQVTECQPSLVPFEIEEDFCRNLMGLSLRNVTLSCYTKKKNKDKLLYQEQGEMLFTHFGISGPLVLSASAYTGKAKGEPIWVEIDLKPALTIEQLDARILRDFDAAKNKQVRNALDELLPKKLIPVMIELAEIDPFKQVNAVTKEERERLIACMKKLTLHVVGTRGYEEAIITRGGVSVKEINPKTMEAKQIPGLYFIGEVLDVDALTGGFNLQIAWATAATVLLSE